MKLIDIIVIRIMHFTLCLLQWVSCTPTLSLLLLMIGCCYCLRTLDKALHDYIVAYSTHIWCLCVYDGFVFVFILFIAHVHTVLAPLAPLVAHKMLFINFICGIFRIADSVSRCTHSMCTICFIFSLVYTVMRVDCICVVSYQLHAYMNCVCARCAVHSQFLNDTFAIVVVFYFYHHIFACLITYSSSKTYQRHPMFSLRRIKYIEYYVSCS